jgi:MFS family permease
LLGALIGVLDRVSAAMGGAGGHGYIILFGGFLGSLYALLQFLCAPVFGTLSDRFGRKPILMISLTGMALSYVLWFVAGRFAVLILARLVGGLMSGNISTASAVIADVTPGEQRSRGMAMLGFAVGMGFMVGPPLGGIASLIDLSRLFPGLTVYGVNPYSSAALAAFVLAAANWACVALFLQETLPQRKETAGYIKRRISPVAMMQFREYPGVSRTNLTYFVFLLAFSGMEFSLSFMTTDRLGYGPTQITAMMIFVGVVLAMMQGSYVRRFSGVIGPKRMSIHGLMLCIPGLALVGFAPNSPMLYLGLLVMTIGAAQVRPCLSALVSLYAPEREQGRVLGVFRSLEALARAAGPVLACLLYWRLGPSKAYYIAAAIQIIPLALVQALPPPAEAPRLNAA